MPCRSPPARGFWCPIPFFLAGLLVDGEANQLPLHITLTHPQWECYLRLSWNHSDHSYKCLACPDLLLLHLHVQQFGHPNGKLIWELQMLVKSGMNHFMWYPVSLSKFPDILLSVITLVAILAMEALSWAFSNPPLPVSSPSLFDNCLYLRFFSSRHLIIDLLGNFLKLLKAFSGCTEWFHEIAKAEIGAGKERKINSELAMVILVASKKGSWSKTVGKWMVSLN